ncbi:hypothetical protein ACPWR0_22700 [Pandoraea pneumonica]|uniref:hypothetical protein n=1 Tax=Pandoraea pneumonica TaxID=2508299 RepID=UPI003CE981CB
MSDVKRNFGILGALMVALMLGACANTGSGAGDSSASARSGGTGKVEMYGVIDAGVTSTIK